MTEDRLAEDIEAITAMLAETGPLLGDAEIRGIEGQPRWAVRLADGTTVEIVFEPRSRALDLSVGLGAPPDDPVALTPLLHLPGLWRLSGTLAPMLEPDGSLALGLRLARDIATPAALATALGNLGRIGHGVTEETGRLASLLARAGPGGTDGGMQRV